MSHQDELQAGLREGFSHLTDSVEALRTLVRSSDGAIQQYRMARLDQAIETQGRLRDRLSLIERTEGEQRWTDAEKLWSDLRNAVLGTAGHA